MDVRGLTHMRERIAIRLDMQAKVVRVAYARPDQIITEATCV